MVALKKIAVVSGEVNESIFSHPPGTPVTVSGNFMVFLWMQLQGVSVLDFANDLEIRGALRGVVIMMAFAVMWPGAMRGNNSMCS